MYVCGYESKTGKDRREKREKHKFVLDKYLLQSHFIFDKPQSYTEIMKMLISYITHDIFHWRLYERNLQGKNTCFYSYVHKIKLVYASISLFI